ncbi:hypothetical protein VSWAT3_05361 [Vibrionales bacterium SWAT-3]|nr:hypothetical protein VSWAT3_05361 [Vibrionales bacterium SWAT-3]
MNNKKLIMSLAGVGILAYLSMVYTVDKNDQRLAAESLAHFHFWISHL